MKTGRFVSRGGVKGQKKETKFFGKKLGFFKEKISGDKGQTVIPLSSLSFPAGDSYLFHKEWP